MERFRTTITQAIGLFQCSLQDRDQLLNPMIEKCLVCSPEGYSICDTPTDWDKGSRIMRLQCPNNLLPIFLSVAIDFGGREYLSKVLATLRAGNLTRALGLQAANEVALFVGLAMHLQAEWFRQLP
jgi:hypothetical protein